MSSETYFSLQAIPPGMGLALDLGGNSGTLRQPLQKRGYQYINLDIKHFENGEPSLISDAHRLPFKDATLDIVVSKDTLEHFSEPWVVVKEVHRVLKQGGQFIIWVPFMHPFHGDDLYRYSPLGLRKLLGNFEVIACESPLWIFTVVGSAVSEIFKRLHLGFVERPIKYICGVLDQIFPRDRTQPSSFAAAYRIVARK